MLTAILLIHKYYDDAYYNNKVLADIGGVSVEEINQLEIEFLQQINFNIYVKVEEYKMYRLSIDKFFCNTTSLQI